MHAWLIFPKNYTWCSVVVLWIICMCSFIVPTIPQVFPRLMPLVVPHVRVMFDLTLSFNQLAHIHAKEFHSLNPSRVVRYELQWLTIFNTHSGILTYSVVNQLTQVNVLKLRLRIEKLKPLSWNSSKSIQIRNSEVWQKDGLS